MEFAQGTIIRTLGLYQPFASLMLHGKIETRLIEVGKKPPFKEGKYIIYSTKKKYSSEEVYNIAGALQQARIDHSLSHEPTKYNIQQAICIGDLVEVRPMAETDEDSAFVQYHGIIKKLVPDRGMVPYKQWCLIFRDMKRIVPFDFKDANGKSLGKQGVGVFPVELYKNIHFAS